MGTIVATHAQVIREGKRRKFLDQFNWQTTAGVHVMTPGQLRMLLETVYEGGYVEGGIQVLEELKTTQAKTKGGH